MKIMQPAFAASLVVLAAAGCGGGGGGSGSNAAMLWLAPNGSELFVKLQDSEPPPY
jgi:hypothetical protein